MTGSNKAKGPRNGAAGCSKGSASLEWTANPHGHEAKSLAASNREYQLICDAAGKWHLIQRIVRGNYRTLCTLHVSDTIDQCKAVAERYELLSRQCSEPLTIDH